MGTYYNVKVVGPDGSGRLVLVPSPPGVAFSPPGEDGSVTLDLYGEKIEVPPNTIYVMGPDGGTIDSWSAPRRPTEFRTTTDHKETP